MEEFTSFLGTGWTFPPTFDLGGYTARMSSDETDIRESLEILLSTKLGERIMEPGYGCNLEDLLFESMDLTLKTIVVDQIRTAILYHEPRIDAQEIDITDGDVLRGELLIKIEYVIRSTNSRTNLVFPFYKEEGSEI
jgi:uncharacterized protein